MRFEESMIERMVLGEKRPSVASTLLSSGGARTSNLSNDRPLLRILGSQALLCPEGDIIDIMQFPLGDFGSKLASRPGCEIWLEAPKSCQSTNFPVAWYLYQSIMGLNPLYIAPIHIWSYGKFYIVTDYPLDTFSDPSLSVLSLKFFCPECRLSRTGTK